MNKATHAQRFISFKQIKHRRRNEIANSQKSKVLTNKPNSRHFSQWHNVPKIKGVSSKNKHLIRIKRFYQKIFQRGKEDTWELQRFLGNKIRQ